MHQKSCYIPSTSGYAKSLGGDGNWETLLLFSNAFRGKIETFASDLTEEDKATLGIVAE